VKFVIIFLTTHPLPVRYNFEMSVESKANEYLRLRRGLLNNDDLPPPFNLEDLIFQKKYYKGNKIKSLWQEYVSNPNHKPIDFYIHVPYCYTKCSYCTCPSEGFSFIKAKNYVDNLITFLTSFEEVFKGSAFRNLYIGGGTPSVLTDSELDRLLGYLFSHFSFEKDGGKCSEMNPLSVTESKIAILKKYKFNRISFGVQSLNHDVLSLNNRGYQTVEMVEKAIYYAKKAGIVHINTDLIIGLIGDTKEIFLDNFAKLLKYRPFTISVYPLVPTKEYIKKFFHGKLDEFYNFYNKHIKECLDEVSVLATNANYLVPDFSKLYLNHLLPSCWNYRDKYIESLKKSYVAGFEDNVSVFGIGKYAESKIDGVIKYRRTNEYGDINSCVFSGLATSPRFEMIFFITKTLSIENKISLSEFKNLFNVDLLDVFKKEIKILLKLKAVTIDSKSIHFSIENKKDRFLFLSCFYTDEEVKRYFENRKKKCKSKTSKIEERVMKCLDEKDNIARYIALSRSISTLPIGNVINGVISKLKDYEVDVINDKNICLTLRFVKDCIFTCEYSKNNKAIYEEMVPSSEILLENIRLVFFMDRINEKEILMVKNIIPLDY